MPRDAREGPIVVNLSGERARKLAHRLLAPGLDLGSDPATERLLGELTQLTGGGTRVAHDWDPQTGRLTLAAGR